MVELSRSQFLDQIRSRGLLAEPEILSHAEAAPGEEAWPLAERFRHAGLLTAYQIDQLLAGRPDRLTFAGYRLLDPISADGLIYRAADPHSGQQVWLAVLPIGVAAPATIERVLLEAVPAQHLQHPHLAHVIATGRHADGGYVAYDWPPGRDLASLVREAGPLPWTLAVRFVVQAAQGLDLAHRNGLVHRQLAPAAIWVGPCEGDPPTPRTDAVARLTGIGLGALVGDPMSPPLATAADIAADLERLGRTLVELLTGRPLVMPHEWPSDLPAGIRATMIRLVDGAAGHPPILSADEVVQALGQSLGEATRSPEWWRAAAAASADESAPLGEWTSPPLAEAVSFVGRSPEEAAPLGEWLTPPIAEAVSFIGRPPEDEAIGLGESPPLAESASSSGVTALGETPPMAESVSNSGHTPPPPTDHANLGQLPSPPIAEAVSFVGGYPPPPPSPGFLPGYGAALPQMPPVPQALPVSEQPHDPYPGSEQHLDSLDDGSAPVSRRRSQEPEGGGAGWMIMGFLLHGTAMALLLAWLFGAFSSSKSDNDRPEKKRPIIRNAPQKGLKDLFD